MWRLSTHRAQRRRTKVLHGIPGTRPSAPEGQKVDSSGCNPEKEVDGIHGPQRGPTGKPQAFNPPGLVSLARRFRRFHRGLFTFNPFGISSVMAFGFPERPVPR
ncbi:MAG: hypothetical protein MZV63_15125 [Marinilabiliales bacterium]|nr:hypothetical protein [Marinilabiliales bacterium]